MCGGGSILTAQYWGKKELEPIKTIMMMVLRIVVVVGVAVTVVILFVPEMVMGIYSSDEVVIAEGAAYATLIARFMELVVVMIYVLFKEKALRLTPKSILRRDKVLSADLRRYCTPVVINELVWSIGISAQAALFGHLSTLAVSANTIISVVQNISYAGTSIIGILRGGGDAKFCLYVELVALWGVSIPLGYIAGLWLQLPIVVVFALFKSDEIVKAVCCIIRQRKDKWINEVTR